jgi:hypothetical protein
MMNNLYPDEFFDIHQALKYDRPYKGFVPETNLRTRSLFYEGLLYLYENGKTKIIVEGEVWLVVSD